MLIGHQISVIGGERTTCNESARQTISRATNLSLICWCVRAAHLLLLRCFFTWKNKGGERRSRIRGRCSNNDFFLSRLFFLGTVGFHLE